LRYQRKHGVDSLREFSLVCLVDATCVNPEIVQTISPCLLAAEINLFVSGFVLAIVVHQVLVSDLLRIPPPGVRKYRVRIDYILLGQIGGEASSPLSQYVKRRIASYGWVLGLWRMNKARRLRVAA